LHSTLRMSSPLWLRTIGPVTSSRSMPTYPSNDIRSKSIVRSSRYSVTRGSGSGGTNWIYLGEPAHGACSVGERPSGEYPLPLPAPRPGGGGAPCRWGPSGARLPLANLKYPTPVARSADGQSGGETPGLIPNPEVKPTGVPRGTEVREPTGTAESCQPPPPSRAV